jgi:hypothetical protein
MLQSHGGVLRIFPALPERIGTCSFSTLRAEGAFLVSARCRNGKTERVEITSLSGGRCSVQLFRYDVSSLVDFQTKDTSAEAVREGDNQWCFDTTAGTEYSLSVAGSDEPVSLQPFRENGAVDCFTDCYGDEIYYGRSRSE